MPPRSPLPQRQGLDAAWLRTPDNDPDAHSRWATMRDFLVDRFPAVVPVAGMLGAGEFVDQSGRRLTWEELYRPNAFVWFHRPLAP